ncbi:MAG: hypothetical protein ACSLEX_01400 [Minisyncoccota bacterium]
MLFLNKIFGWIYFKFKWYSEVFRFKRSSVRSKVKEYGVITEILGASKELLILLILGFTFYLLGDWFVNSVSAYLSNLKLLQGISLKIEAVTLPETEFIRLFLEISIGAISAILGIIFALYAVGIQLSTQNFSSEVSEYLNSEVATNVYFKLLVFTDLLAIFLLLRNGFFPSSQMMFSFFVICILVGVCVLGIVVFKQQYLFILKPKYLFERLSKDIKDSIIAASDLGSFEQKSWNIIHRFRDRTKTSLELIERLFEDLIESKKTNDLKYAPIVLGYVLSRYVESKRYINNEKDWWFYHSQQPAKSEGMAGFALKNNYEIRGMGPLFETRTNFSWFEDMVFRILKKVQEHSSKENDLLGYVIQAYQRILSREFSYPERNKLRGAYTNQEFVVYEKFFPSFLELSSSLEEEDFIDFLNAYFAIGLTLIEGSKHKKLKRAISSFYNKLGGNREHFKAINLPTIQYEEMLNYWDMIDLERETEGKIITPHDFLEKEVMLSVKNKEERVFKKYFKEILEHQDKWLKELVEKKDYRNCAELIKMRLIWLARLFYLKKSEVTEEYVSHIKILILYVGLIPKDIVVELDFLENLERLIFPCILEKRFKLLSELLPLLIIILATLNQDEKDTEKFILTNRLLVVLGGFLYLHSEFEEDRKGLMIYSKILEVAYNPDTLVTWFVSMKDIKEKAGLDITMKIIERETSRYHHWYGNIHHQIFNLPKKYGNVPHYSGLQEIADHPSEFISQISHYHVDAEDESIEKFVEWMQKRKAVENLILTLRKRKNEKSN